MAINCRIGHRSRAIFNPVGEEIRTEINESGGVIYDATEQPGIYSAHISGKQPRYFVVNPDTIESNLAARDPEELTSMLTGGEKAILHGSCHSRR